MNGEDLSPRIRTVGVVSWCSFLVAAAATMVVFAFVDPQSVHVPDGPDWTRDRRTIYALGFFAFWIVAAGSAALTMYMAHTDRADVESG